ncbi:MAG: glycolate oxidase subunit GlcE [Gammaproteobacteria bacterium]|nr:glycolate oxidase subunit GlcE [Gammaproteobacteria bacterium]
MSNDTSQVLQQQVVAAMEQDIPLQIVGGNSKAFYGRNIGNKETLSVHSHSGILTYEPTELVLTARAGTLLREIEKTLHENNQMLGFEPPAFGDRATLGGTIAGNFSGPRRAYAGAARDFVLGCKLLNGKGEILSFGGEVMKNVAGYDISRLMVGGLGTLGVLLDVSLKVLPKPDVEKTRVIECHADEALQKMHHWAGRPLPISATCFYRSQLMVRLSGAEKAVKAAADVIGGDDLPQGDTFWRDVKEQKLTFFQTQKPVWRLSVASDTAPFMLEDESLYEWGGALRWLVSEMPHEVVRNSVADGHACVFRNHAGQGDVFQALSPGLMRIHQQLKKAFDPKGILNPGKLYAEF